MHGCKLKIDTEWKVRFYQIRNIDTNTYFVSIGNAQISYRLAAGSYQLDTRPNTPILNLTDTTTFVSNSYPFETKMDTFCHFVYVKYEIFCI